jgi:endonuclease-3
MGSSKVRVIYQPVPARSKTLPAVLDTLEALYGPPPPPATTDPFPMILFENVAYVADDECRAEAWRRLEETVGVTPQEILAASRKRLLAAAKAGMFPEKRAERLREIAAMAIEEHGGDLGDALDRRPADAMRILKRFPSIGDPGAERILLFSGRRPVLALDSNGLRVLLRLGYGREEKSYAASYRSAQTAAAPECSRDIDGLIRGHQLLRRHGQVLCRRTRPRCDACPVRRRCAYGRSGSPA